SRPSSRPSLLRLFAFSIAGIRNAPGDSPSERRYVMRWAATSLLPADPTRVTAELARGIRPQGFSGASWHLADPDAWSVAEIRGMVDRLAEGGVALAQLLPPQYPS